MNHDADIVVVGGGLVGACAGALLARHSGIDATRILLFEEKLPAQVAVAAPFDLRVSALSRASQRILASAGAWQALPRERACPYQRMQVWHAGIAPHGGAALVFDAAELGEPDLGCILENRAMQVALLDAFTRAGGRVEARRLTGLRFEPDAAILTSAEGELRARLVLAADGANSQARDWAGLASQVHDYGQTAIVATVGTARPHASTAWQTFLDTGPLAFLPLADGTSSVVWSCLDEEARRLLALDASGFAQALESASDLVLGPVHLVSERASFALRGLAADRYVAERFALLGDAAHVIHPLAGQGVNQGLLDAAALCDALARDIAQGEDPGALRSLRRYERWRRSENQLMAAVVDQFDRAFTHGGMRRQLARRGLSMAARSAVLRNFFARRALGVASGVALPRFARA